MLDRAYKKNAVSIRTIFIIEIARINKLLKKEKDQERLLHLQNKLTILNELYSDYEEEIYNIDNLSMSIRYKEFKRGFTVCAIISIFLFLTYFFI